MTMRCLSAIPMKTESMPESGILLSLPRMLNSYVNSHPGEIAVAAGPEVLTYAETWGWPLGEARFLS